MASSIRGSKEVANVKASDGTEPMSDGGHAGEPEIQIFTQTADVPAPTRNERIVRFLDKHVYAPLAVIKNDIRGLIGLSILVFFVGMGTVGVLLIERAVVMEAPIYAAPFQSLEYPLGADNMGRPMHKMIIHATPAMLEMTLAGAIFSAVTGTIIGVVSGYKGGMLDQSLMAFTDTVLTIPGLVFVIVLASFYPPTSPWVVGLILAIDSWPGLARMVRSQVLSIREESFTEASRIMGLSQLHILWKDVISNLMPYISINFAEAARLIIFSSVALYFLGILPFTTANWGVMMNEAYQAGDITDPGVVHWLYIPMFAIIFFSLGFILFAQALDRVFNVRLRARHAKTAVDTDDELQPAD